MSRDSREASTGAPRSRHDAIDLTNEDSPSGAIDLTGSNDDDEDEDLKAAIALSLQDQVNLNQVSVGRHVAVDTQPQTKPSVHSEQNQPTQQPPSKAVSGILGLDRKQMEAERLARLKRKHEATEAEREISPPPLRRNPPPSLQAISRTPIASRPKSDVSRDQDTSTTNVMSHERSRSNVKNAHLSYSDGRVLLTSLNNDHEKSTSLSEILAPVEEESVLKSALLSTFIVDFDWLLPHFDTRTVSFVLALHARNEQQQETIERDFKSISNVRLVFPHIGGIVNCMHSKLMILFYEHTSKDRMPVRCRIVIPSANLVPWDWGVGAVMENILFVIDLPPKKGTKQVQETEFQKTTIHMLEAMGVLGAVVSKLDQFDFSNTSSYQFVHTIGGSHALSALAKPLTIRSFMPSSEARPTSAVIAQKTTNTKSTGVMGLYDAVRHSGLAVSHEDLSYPLRLDFITSSLGNLKDSFLQNLYLAACGITPETSRKESGVTKSSQSSLFRNKIDLGKPDMVMIMENFRIYFPSEETVQNSKGGPNSAGTICFQSQWWDSTSNGFPKAMVSDCVGIRSDKVLMHSKVLFARFARPKKLDLTEASIAHECRASASVETIQPSVAAPLAARSFAGWAYVGSANLSESAWGSLVVDSKTKQPKLNCRNWESGVLVPIPAKPEHEGQNLHELTLEEVFGHVMPVPIKYPGISLLESGRKPWFFNS